MQGPTRGQVLWWLRGPVETPRELSTCLLHKDEAGPSPLGAAPLWVQLYRDSIGVRWVWKM